MFRRLLHWLSGDCDVCVYEPWSADPKHDLVVYRCVVCYRVQVYKACPVGEAWQER